MCGGGSDAADEAAQRERERQQRIAQATAQVNAALDDPSIAARVDEHRAAVEEVNTRELDRQSEEAARNARFNLARSGLSGGSVDVDENARLAEAAREGVTRVSEVADSAAQALRRNNEQTRARVVGLIQGGLDGTTAAQQALSGAALNADQAAADNQVAAIGDVFADLALAQRLGQVGAGVNAARAKFNTNPITVGAPTSGSSGGGTVTQIG